MATDDTVDLLDRGATAVDAADAVVRREQIDLVWAASAALGERDASILDLHLRHDLDPGEIAEALDITPNAAHQTLFRLRRRLEGAIRSWVLWDEGRPGCPDLAAHLDVVGVASFGPAAVRAISSHVAECETCDAKHAAVLAPASLFAAVPMVAVAAGVREAAAAALADQGVPIELTSATESVSSPELVAQIATTEPTTTEPTTTEPTTTKLPTTEPPTTEPPPTEPPRTTTEPPTTSEPPTTTTATPPRVRSFTAAHVGSGICEEGARGDIYQLTWMAEHTDEATLDGPYLDQPGPHPPEGAAEACLPFRTEGTWTLTANGPGGTATAVASAP